MEYNNENSFQEKEPVILKEKEHSSNGLWYLILVLLLLGLLGWFGYVKGWFGAKKVDLNNNGQETVVDVIPGLEGESANLLQTNAPIDNIIINSKESFPVQKTLVVKGNLPNGCTYLNDPQVIRSGNAFYVNLTTRQEGDVCTEALVPYERNIALDVVGLPAGVYTVSINGKTTQFELEQDNKIDFSAGAEK